MGRLLMVAAAVLAAALATASPLGPADGKPNATATAPAVNKTTTGGGPGKKYVVPFSNDPVPVVVGGVHMLADLPPMVQTPCDGCKTVAAASSGAPVIVDTLQMQSSSSRLLPNDNLNTVAMRSGSNSVSYLSSSSSSGSSAVSLSPVRVVTSSSSSPCLPACVASGCSTTCLKLYSVGTGGGVVAVSGVVSAAPAYQHPTYVNDIRTASIVDQAVENSRPSAVAVSASAAGARVSPGCEAASPCYPTCSTTCVTRYAVSPVRVVSSTTSSTCMSACMPSCLPGCVHISVAAPAFVAGGPVQTMAVSRNYAASAAPVSAPTRTVSVSRVVGEPVQVHTVVPSSSWSSSVIATAAAPCAASCMPSCSASCVHVVHTSPMRTVSSTSSSPCLPACVSSGCSVTCLHLYSPSFKQLGAKAGLVAGTGVGQAAATSDPIVYTTLTHQDAHLPAGVAAAAFPLTRVMATAAADPAPFGFTCVASCMPSCSASCVHVVHTSPVRVVTSTASATCMPACMPACDGTCRRLHVASGVSGGIPTQEAGGDVVAMTGNALPAAVVAVTANAVPATATACVSACMPSCSDSCVHVVHTSPVRVVSSTASSPCLPACVASGCDAVCLRMYAVDTGVGSIGHLATVVSSGGGGASRRGEPTHDGMRVSSGLSGGVPTTGGIPASAGDAPLVLAGGRGAAALASTGSGCVTACMPACSGPCLTRVQAVPVATVGVVQPHFKQVNGQLVSMDEAAARAMQAQQQRQQQQQRQEQVQVQEQEQHQHGRALAQNPPHIDTIIIVLVCGIVVVVVSVAVAVYLLVCKRRSEGDYTNVAKMDGAETADPSDAFGEPDANPDSDDDAQAGGGGDGVTEGGNVIWSQQRRDQQLHGVGV